MQAPVSLVGRMNKPLFRQCPLAAVKIDNEGLTASELRDAGYRKPESQ